MTKLLPTLLIATTLLSGCFTTAGALIGGSVASSNDRARSEKVARGERVETDERVATDEENPVLVGVVLGVALDVLATYAVVSSMDSGEPIYPYGEPGGSHF